MRPQHKMLICAVSIVAALVAASLTGCPASSSRLPFRETVRGEPFTAQNWDMIETNPDAYGGRQVTFVGRVFAPFDVRQMPANIQVFVNPKDATGVAVVAVATDPGVRPGDFVAVEGRIVGEFKGEGTFSGTGVAAVLVQASSLVATALPSSPSRSE